MFGGYRYYQSLAEETYRVGKKLGIKHIDPDKIDEYVDLLHKKEASIHG